MTICTRTSSKWCLSVMLLALAAVTRTPARADTVASLLGNFTINQYSALTLSTGTVEVHYAVVFGQLPALRELHLADTNGDGVTSQAERDAYVGGLAPHFADALQVRVDGAIVPLRATRWSTSLPTEQGGFSLRVDVDFSGVLPPAAGNAPRLLEFGNENYAGRMGWHEIVVEPRPGLAIFDTNAYGTSLTGGLTEALQSLPPGGPLDERSVHLRFAAVAPPHAAMLTARGGGPVQSPKPAAGAAGLDVLSESVWITRHTRRLVEEISAPHVAPRIAALALLAAMLLGAVHALSPGHGKTIVGAYLIGSRGTPRHAVFLGLTVTITHTLGVFALGFATLYASRFIVPERLFPILSLLSAVLVLGMGVVLLVQRGRAARAALSMGPRPALNVFVPVKPLAGAGGGARGLIFAPATHYADPTDPTLHSHGGGPLHSHLPPGASGEKITWRSLLALGISGGLVPCPSAMVLLLAAVALNKTALGLLLVLAFSLGLAVTLTFVGLAFLYARNRFNRPTSHARWAHLLPVMSAGTITVVGVALCLGALRSFGS
jgi:ABC-type nickel/cobalt efflux system permease component RcnA